MNKRGLSPVVANVLLILLVIAAIALMWGFIRFTITDTGDEISSRIDCISIDLELISCSSTSPESVYIKRNAGKGALRGYAIQLVDEDEFTILPQAVYRNETYEIQELETILDDAFAAGGLSVEDGDHVVVAAILTDGTVCAPTQPPVECNP